MAFPENRSTLPAILDHLACPACLGELLLESEALACTRCSRRYPIHDGIPVLISDRANLPE